MAALSTVNLPEQKPEKNARNIVIKHRIGACTQVTLDEVSRMVGGRVKRNSGSANVA
jgi:hypothetical protein